MKLYYSPLACSLAAHIACREAGLDVRLTRVDLPTKRTEHGGDLFAENPMGQVPTLVLADGRILTENVAVLAYLAGRMPNDASERESEPHDGYELARWLSFVATEIHKRILWPIFAPGAPGAVKDYARQSAGPVLEALSARLDGRDSLTGGSFSVADAYLFWALTILPHAGVPLDRVPVLRRYRELHRKRSAVHAALTYEKARFEAPFASA